MRTRKSNRDIKLLPRPNFIKKMVAQRINGDGDTTGLPLNKFLQLQERLAGSDRVVVTPPKKKD